MAAALSPALKAAFEAASLPGDAAPPRALHVVPQARGALELEAQLPPAAGKTDREEWDGTLKQIFSAAPTTPAYVLWRLDTCSSAGLYEWLLVAFRPAGAPVRQRLLYPTTLEGIQSGLGEWNFLDIVYGSSPTDFTYPTRLRNARKHDYQNPQVRIQAPASEAAGASVGGARRAFAPIVGGAIKSAGSAQPKAPSPEPRAAVAPAKAPVAAAVPEQKAAAPVAEASPLPKDEPAPAPSLPEPVAEPEVASAPLAAPEPEATEEHGEAFGAVEQVKPPSEKEIAEVIAAPAPTPLPPLPADAPLPPAPQVEEPQPELDASESTAAEVPAEVLEVPPPLPADAPLPPAPSASDEPAPSAEETQHALEPLQDAEEPAAADAEVAPPLPVDAPLPPAPLPTDEDAPDAEEAQRALEPMQGVESTLDAAPDAAASHPDEAEQQNAPESSDAAVPLVIADASANGSDAQAPASPATGGAPRGGADARKKWASAASRRWEVAGAGKR